MERNYSVIFLGFTKFTLVKSEKTEKKKLTNTIKVLKIEKEAHEYV